MGIKIPDFKFQIPNCFQVLPICSVWDELVSAVKKNQILIVSGETGSGKSTQLPKICLAAGRGVHKKIVCTQPRRVAAITLAERVAEELGPDGSRIVGYKIRFKDRTGPETRIKFATDGVLLAEVQRDSRLKTYDTIIVDEAHERSLNIDFLLGIIRKLLPVRPELKVIITSATMDTAHFSTAFGNVPVIEIAGRNYPVEIHYRPQLSNDDCDINNVENVIFAIEEIRQKDPFGHILVFLPTEREILETVKILRGRYQENEALVLPMYSRLAASNQKCVFRPSQVQKIVVATNIAETSITIPGIKYVIDTGLARISRYNARSRTKALPVAPISRASADQRAGRAGRVQAGVCIRLYSEEDYWNRPEHTLPEIRRSNLAEVILRLQAMNHGPVESFPFVDPPSPLAIKEGFTTLRELGALDVAGRLTKRGRIMARLPLDPRISRMILQARHEESLNKVVVIAAALSIQDPRERPAEKQSKADQAHASFKDPASDLLSFIKIWDEYHHKLKAGCTKNQLRKYCQENFLSYNRMQEWIDIHNQITDILKESKDFTRIASTPGQEGTKSSGDQIYSSIHRSVLSGFLSQIAIKQEGSRYLAARGREVFLFPGSSVYKKRPKWIVSTEMVRTSRLFARTVAAIEPEWIEDLAGDLCRHTYFEPHWEKRRGEVMAYETVTLYGLPVAERRKVRYAKIDPDKCREIFIYEALIPGELKNKYSFLVHNIELISELQEMEDRTRRKDILVDEEVLYSFYDRRLRVLEKIVFEYKVLKNKQEQKPESIFSERSLARALRLSNSDHILRLTKEDLLRTVPGDDVLIQFPGHIQIWGHSLSLSYRFNPGDEADGVTVKIPFGVLTSLSPEPFEWLVPGMLKEKITYLLKSLPKQIRKNLVPISRVAEKLEKALDKTEKGLLYSLQKELFKQYGIHVQSKMWPKSENIPPHLLMRFEILDRNGKVIDSGNDLKQLQEKWKKNVSAFYQSDPEWLRIKSRWEMLNLNLRNFPELPGSIISTLGYQKGPVQVFPGISLEEGHRVNLRLFLNQDQALSETQKGARQLLIDYLNKEFKYLLKNCIPQGLSPETCLSFGGEQKLRLSIYAFLCRELLGSWEQIPSRSDLLNRAEKIKGKVFQQAIPHIQLLKEVLVKHSKARQEIGRLQNTEINRKTCAHILKELKAELTRLTPPDFPENARSDQLPHLPRYLNALAVRAVRAYADPLKDKTKASTLEPFLLRINKAKDHLKTKNTKELTEEIRQFEMLVDEYRVSVFAPELGTSTPVSSKRLRDAWERLKVLF